MMRMHSFSGATSREVLQKVKQALGDDALIVSNREVAGGIEVVALAATDAEFDAPAPSRISGPTASGESLDGILTEIQNLKLMLREQRAASRERAVSHDLEMCVTPLRELVHCGFTEELAKKVISAISSEGAAGTPSVIAERLKQMLKLTDSDEMIERGGVYALVGPTGVGKTTTVAKLAARCVVRFGAAKVALLTTDSYRIGGYDQLRIYARILGVSVHVVRDADDLRATLGELSGRHLVLIDTIGMSHRDRMVAEQAALLAGSANIKRLLLLQATTNTQTLNHFVTAYREHGIHGCIITKTDEAAGLAPALDAAIRHELPLHYVTDGQRVPEDLQLPDSTALVEQALHPAKDEAPDFQSAAAVASVSDAGERFLGTPAPAADQATMRMPKVMRPLGRHVQTRVVHG
jgi:flagellar biosynthesis protein FlhF